MLFAWHNQEGSLSHYFSLTIRFAKSSFADLERTKTLRPGVALCPYVRNHATKLWWQKQVSWSWIGNHFLRKPLFVRLINFYILLHGYFMMNMSAENEKSIFFFLSMILDYDEISYHHRKNLSHASLATAQLGKCFSVEKVFPGKNKLCCCLLMAEKCKHHSGRLRILGNPPHHRFSQLHPCRLAWFDSNRRDNGSISPKTSRGSPPFWSKMFILLFTPPLFLSDPLTDSSGQPQTRPNRESNPVNRKACIHTPIPHGVVKGRTNSRPHHVSCFAEGVMMERLKNSQFLCGALNSKRSVCSCCQSFFVFNLH